MKLKHQWYVKHSLFKKMIPIWYIIIIISVIFLLIYMLYTVNTINIIFPTFDLPSTQHQYMKKDCNLEYVYAMEDEQCSNICTAESGTFIHQNGICVNILATQQSESKNDCDVHKGVIAYLTGDTQFGTANLYCLSVDNGIAPNNINEKNKMCKDNGDITIDYALKYPITDDCKCHENYEKILIPSTLSIREHITCVPKTYEKMIVFNNLNHQEHV